VNSGTIIVADDDAAIRTVLNQALGRAGYLVRTTGNAATLWRWASAGEGDLVITDVIMPDENAFELLPRLKKVRPDLPIIVMSAQNTLMTAITAAERGAYEYLPKPFDLNELIGVVKRAMVSKGEKRRTAVEAPGVDELPLIGRSAAMQDIYRIIARLMQTDLTVMISGESGTGKELVAKALHDYGRRRNGPFVAANMAATPREMIDAELFGREHEAGGGSHNRGVGKFEQAEGGTLFLDEIGDMPLEAQTQLLRVLQQGEYTPVGGRQPLKANARIIAATHRDLRQLIHQGLFREDLYFRLNVVPMRLPPLRERLEDIPDLVRHFLSQAEREGMSGKSVDEGAFEAMKRHRWSGNVRELENLVRRFVALYTEPSVTAAMVENELREPAGAGATEDADLPLGTMVERFLTRQFAELNGKLPLPGLYDRVLRDVERPLISICLGATRGNQIKAAEILGVNRNTLRAKIRSLDIPVPRGFK
jgi:two-component system, NtrC family, nitrogen regulation response regulator GlnG